MARLPDLIPIPDFWPIRRFGAHGNLTAVEYLSPAHLAETDVHAKHTREHLAEFRKQHGPNATYKQWIAALHPENVKLDKRLEMQGNTWATLFAENAEGGSAAGEAQGSAPAGDAQGSSPPAEEESTPQTLANIVAALSAELGVGEVLPPPPRDEVLLARDYEFFQIGAPIGDVPGLKLRAAAIDELGCGQPRGSKDGRGSRDGGAGWARGERPCGV